MSTEESSGTDRDAVDETLQREVAPQEQSPERRHQGTGSTATDARGPHAAEGDVEPPPMEEDEQAPPMQPSEPTDHDLGEEEERVGGPAGEGTGEAPDPSGTSGDPAAADDDETDD